MFDVERYPAKVAELLAPPHVEALDAGKPDPSVRSKLAALRASDLNVGERPIDLAMAQACLAGLWLRHNYLDESHQLSQEIDTPTGSYWHAVMHRREGDYGNSKYWFRRVGQHPAMEPLYESVRAQLSVGTQPREVKALLAEPAWDPYQFVDVCAAACSGRNDLVPICRNIQQCEWETLFDFCFAAAVGER